MAHISTCYTDRAMLLLTRCRHPHDVYQAIEVACHLPECAISLLFARLRLELAVGHAIIHALLNAVDTMIQVSDQIRFSGATRLEGVLPRLRQGRGVL